MFWKAFCSSPKFSLFGFINKHILIKSAIRLGLIYVIFFPVSGVAFIQLSLYPFVKLDITAVKRLAEFGVDMSCLGVGGLPPRKLLVFLNFVEAVNIKVLSAALVDSSGHEPFLKPRFLSLR